MMALRTMKKFHAEARRRGENEFQNSASPRENRYSWRRRMSFPKYPKYKDSGVERLVDVPDHWDVVALKRITNLKSGDSITGDSIDETGDYPVLGGNGLRGYTSAFTHDGHFVVIGRQGALCGNINYSTGKFWASEHAVVASPLKRVETVWLGEMLRAMNLNQHSVSAAQPGLSMEFVGNLRTVLPPIADQTKIAAFLGEETSKIDALVEEQRRLIELLKEKRQAVISHAVTKGLNPNAP
jgi:type I restriction enzyme, S subunit